MFPINPKSLFVISLFFIPVSLYAESSSKINVREFCTSQKNPSDFYKELGIKIFPIDESRRELVRFLKLKQDDNCYRAVSNYLNSFLMEKKSPYPEEYLGSFLLLGFAANMPEATKFIEKKIEEGKLLDWLDVFKQSNPESYLNTLQTWAQKIAFLLRKMDNSYLMDPKKYGHQEEEAATDLKTPESIPIWNPILIDKYFSQILVQNKLLKKEEFSSLNIVYAASNQSFRDIFSPKMSKIVKLSEENWLLSFREEPSWVQFRLLPIMEKVGGGLMKRELIWLSKYHQNFKMRAVCGHSLEKVNQL